MGATCPRAVRSATRSLGAMAEVDGMVLQLLAPAAAAGENGRAWLAAKVDGMVLVAVYRWCTLSGVRRKEVSRSLAPAGILLR